MRTIPPSGASPNTCIATSYGCGNSSAGRSTNALALFATRTVHSSVATGRPSVAQLSSFAPSVTRIKHIDNVSINDKVNNNVLERFNGTVRERDKVIRGFKKEDTPILKGQRIFYNYIRPHQALGGATPSQIAGVELNLGRNKWFELLTKSLNTSY